MTCMKGVNIWDNIPKINYKHREEVPNCINLIGKLIEVNEK